MGDRIIQYGKCHICGGDGIWGTPDNPEEECYSCHGAGKVEFGALYLADNVFFAYKILDCLNTSEYNALTNNQKDAVKIILSSGFVNLADGATAKTRLWNFFDEESATRTALEALIA